MSRRCKPGQRARIVSGGSNRGKIVLVVRPYFYPEKVGDAMWPNPFYPWIVTSVGGPLTWRSVNHDSQGTTMTIVVCDTELEPLKDDDDGLTRSTERDKPKPVKKGIQKPARATKSETVD